MFQTEIEIDGALPEPTVYVESVPEPTEKQLAFLARLVADRTPFEGLADPATMSRRDASAAIDKMLQQPFKPRETSAAVVEAGMYRTADGTIYKVQRAVHGSGQLYAKRLFRETYEGRCGGHMEQGPSGFDAPLEYCDEQATCAMWIAGETSVTFEYAPGAVRQLTPADRMSLEDAKAWGALYGVCVVCSRTLTDEKSIAAGIGPVCAGRVG